MERVALKRCRVAVEPNPAGYADDLSGTIGNFTEVRFTTAGMQRAIAAFADESTVQTLFYRRDTKFGHKSVSMTLEASLCSTNEALETGVTATQTTQCKMLAAMCGGYRTDEGSTIASASSATSFSVAASDGAQFIPGTLAAIAVSDTSDIIGSIVPIDTRSTDALTSSIAAHATPTVGAKVYNSQLIYAADVAPASATFLQFLVEEEDRDLIWEAAGCQVTGLTFTFPLGGFATYSANLTGATWLRDDELATPQGGSAISVGTLNGSAPIVCKDGSVVLTPSASTTRTTPHIAEITFAPGIAWGPAPSHNGTEGIAQMVMLRGEQPTVTMLIEKADESWTDVRIAGTKYQMCAQFGNVAGATLGLYCPSMQLIAEPTEEEQNGIGYWRLTWGLQHNQITDDGSTALETAPWYLGQF